MAATASCRYTDRLADSPFADMPDPAEVRPLARGEHFNIIFILAATQLARILTVAFVTWMLFFVMSLVLITPELLNTWSQHTPTYQTLLGYPIPVAQALIKMTMFLGALTFMYVSARAVGDGEYRHKFLDPLIDDLELTLLARNRYVTNSLDNRAAQPTRHVNRQPQNQGARVPARAVETLDHSTDDDDIAMNGAS
jgi:hypothetical protein